MFLIICWIIITVGASVAALFYNKMMDDGHFLSFCLTIYYFTYVYNKIYPIKISVRFCTILIIPSSLILTYVLYHFIGFLSLDPISEESFMIICFTYYYILIHLICEFRMYKNNHKIKNQTFFALIFTLSFLLLFYFFYLNKEYFSFYPLSDEELKIFFIVYSYFGLYSFFEIKFLKNKK